MKKTVLLVFILALATTFCAKKKETPSIKLSQVKWSETSKYQIVGDTIPIGSYLLTNKQSKLGNEEVIELYAVTVVKSANSESRDSSVMILHKDNLRPIKTSKVIISSGTVLSSEVTYSDDKAAIKAKLPAGEKSITIPINKNSYDNDEITTLIGSMELKTGEEKEIYAVVGLSGTSIPVLIKNIGEEKIKVPAGEFDCYQYEMNLVGRVIDIWYEKSETKRMIKYSDIQSKMIMELLP